MRNRTLILLVALVLGAAAVSTPAQAATSWPVSTPEAQGVDSAALVKMLDGIQSADYGIHSLLIIRNGHLILEMYRYPDTADTLQAIHSCTKSFISALVGIALDQGKIKSVDQRMVDFFPGRQMANLDDAKRKITLDNLLTMSSGLDWQGGMLEQPTASEQAQSANWVQFVLDRPVSDAPGSRFVYSSGGSDVISAIVQQSVGTTAEAYARTNLFAPLGITDWYWVTDPQGNSTGGGGLWLRSQDMAKLGALYLNHGAWGDKQVVPQQWVADSTRKHIDAGGQWLSDGYGYQWWVDNKGYFMALGYGGQYIAVVPDKQLIMVVTSGLPIRQFFVPEDLLNQFVIPAAQSSGALPANPNAVAALAARIAAFAQPTALQAATVPSAALPATAASVSGKKYTLDDNPLGWKTISLTFKPDSVLAQVNDQTLKIGVGGVYQANAVPGAYVPPGAPEMLRGQWTRDDTFAIDYFIQGMSERYTAAIHFDGDQVTIRQYENITGSQVVVKGHAG